MTPFWTSVFLDLEADVFEPTVAFWAAVTGYDVSPPRGDHGEFATLVPPTGNDHLRVQRLAEGPTRLHLDLHVADPRAAADRAVDLGATEVTAVHGYVVLRSPAGLTFCFVTHPAATPAPPASWPGGRSTVDQVAVDLPPSVHHAERAFWKAVTGFDDTPATMPQFSRLDGPGALRLLFQRLDDERPAGMHLDLSADDRAAETTRHVAIGATVVRAHDHWTVLTDPAGSAYCITDRVPGTFRHPSGT